MKLNSIIRSFFFILIFISAAKCFPQELDITSQLKKIEAGEKDDVINILPGLKQQYPQSSSVIYLNALLTEDGDKAYQLYKTLADKYPKSKYADDAIYRIYRYFSAVEKMDKAEFYLNRLKIEYPESPYLNLVRKASFSEMTKVTVKTEQTQVPPSTKEKLDVKDYKFTIQAGAFTNKENAVQLKSDFDKAGYSSRIIEKSVGGSLFHVVNVGKFTSDEEAKSFLILINNKFKLQGWVVKLD